MGGTATRATRYVSVAVDTHVDVKVADVLSDISDEDIADEYHERFCANAPFDLLEEVRAEIMARRPEYALALIESHLQAGRISDRQRRKQYADAARAH